MISEQACVSIDSRQGQTRSNLRKRMQIDETQANKKASSSIWQHMRSI